MRSVESQIHSHWVGTLADPGAALSAPEPFVLAGLEWVAPVRARIELRACTASGRWTPWTLASVQGHDSDAGESAAHACFGEPVWTGEAVALQLRSAQPVQGLSVHLVPAALITAASPVRANRAQLSPGGLALAQPSLPAGPGQPPIIARSAWAGDRGPATPPVYGDVRMMFVHHSVNANGYSAAEVPAMLLSIYEFHRYVRGWNDIGYNFAIDAYGRVWEAREGGIDQAVVGAQAGGYNLESSGVVMLGTFAAVLPTAAALSTLQRLLAWKLSLHGVPVSGHTTLEVDPTDAFYTAFAPGQRVSLPRIAGHRDGCTTDCPGDDLYAHLPVVRTNVEAMLPRQLGLTLDFGAGQDTEASRYLSLATARVTVGETVSLAGRLAQLTATGTGGAPVSDAALELESLEGQIEGVVNPSEITGGAGVPFSLITDADGRFSLEFSPTRNLLVRALKSEAPAVASPLLAVGVAPAVTLEVAQSAPLTLTGSVTPPKATLELRAYDAGGRRALKHQQTFVPLADGTFSLSPQLKRGTYLIRVVAPADADNLVGESPRLTVRV